MKMQMSDYKLKVELAKDRQAWDERRSYRKLPKYFDRWEFSYFVTLTFKVDVSAATATKDLEHFNKCVLSKLYGRRSRGSDYEFSFLAVLEYQMSGRPHFHLVVQPYDDRTRPDRNHASSILDQNRNDFISDEKGGQRGVLNYIFKQTSDYYPSEHILDYFRAR